MCGTAQCTRFALDINRTQTKVSGHPYRSSFSQRDLRQFPSCVGQHDCDYHQNYSVFGESERALSNGLDTTNAGNEPEGLSQFAFLSGLCRQQLRDAGRGVGNAGGLGQSFTIQGLRGFPGGGKRTLPAHER